VSASVVGPIGVIGGMGPLATADYFAKVIGATTADDDEGHVPLLISSDPRIPRRPPAILHGDTSPLPRLREIRDRLVAAGVSALVMPCNTAHYWHTDLSADCALPFPSIVESACREAAARAGAGSLVGLVATRATLAARLYEPALAALGLRPLLPDDALLDEAMLPAIADVKAGRVAEAGTPMARAVQALRDQGAAVVILACTEAPIAMSTAPAALQALCIDSTAALARTTVALWGTLNR
jgi:aspartate racemase